MNYNRHCAVTKNTKFSSSLYVDQIHNKTMKNTLGDNFQLL